MASEDTSGPNEGQAEGAGAEVALDTGNYEVIRNRLLESGSEL